MTMPEASTTNSRTKEDSSVVESMESVASIKEEEDVKVKPEPVECMVCVGRSADALDVQNTTTTAGTSLVSYLSKFMHTDISASQNDTKYVCKTCVDLVNVLESAELEYLKLKETFESILSRNPLFDIHVSVSAEHVKNETAESSVKDLDDDSEDEPLALTKKKRHSRVQKCKRPPPESKRKVRNKINKDTRDVEVSISRVDVGSLPMVHEESTEPAAVIKKEDSDSSQCASGNHLDGLKLEDCFDDDDDDYVPDAGGGAGGAGGRCRRERATRAPRAARPAAHAPRKKREAKVMHQCDQCSAKYTTQLRLEKHKMKKHDDSKPPYICEVCGAHYKHKRACDIHVAMHKGISDWKCEECNKLFPSKGALQRHNNIHTGKLNYQCDLCGKSFIHTSSFKMHKLSHSGVKPHACDVCGLALMTRSHLKRHKRIHSGEKRHECAVCGKRFSERYNLLAHGKSHEGAAAAAAAPPAPRRRLFRCAFCQERFERQYLLERHMGAAHGRALERPPPTPRNTMSKLLKAQALRRDVPHPHPHPGTHPHAAAPPPADPAAADSDSKLNRSPETRALTGTSLKLGSQLSSATAEGGAPSAWVGAYTEFGLRHDFAH